MRKAINMKLTVTGSITVLLFISALTINNACKKEETPGQKPEVLTQAATNITSTGATLNASVNANNLSAAVTFEYGTDLSYGQTIAADQSPVTGNTDIIVNAPVTGLTPGTTWHFRVKAVNNLGTTYGNDLTFTVLGQVPEVLTQSATEITSTGATLNATVNANYLSAAITFEYGTDLSYGQTIAADQSPVTGNTDTNVSAQISGLVPGTTCHFRVKAVNELGTAYGNDMNFTITYIVLPPSESMVIDFSNFSANKKSAGLKGTETSAWEFAATVSGVWNSLISLNLEIPITSFRYAKDYEPVYLGDSTWQWNYTFSVNSLSYTARLIGKTRPNDVYWEMYITQEGTGGFADFLWFKGTSGPDGLEGQWIFNQSPASPVEMFRNEWTKTEDLISSVKYTYIIDDTSLNSYILYGLTTGSPNAGYSIHFTNGLYSDADIEWNTTDLTGRLKCADYLHDINWHCWDSNRINIVCP